MFVLKSRRRNDFLASYCGWGQMYCLDAEESLMFPTQQDAEEEFGKFKSCIESELGGNEFGDLDVNDIMGDIEVVEIPDIDE